jgi:hypothetical protein
MSASAYTPEPEILHLLGKLCAEDLSGEDAALLVSRLETDERLREFYVVYLNLHAELMWSTVSQAIPADAVPWTDELLLPVRPRPSLRISPVWLAVAATLMLAAYFVGLPALIGLDRAWRMAAGVFRQDRQPHQVVANDPVATIRETANVEWSDHVDKSLRDLQTASRRDVSTKVSAGEPLAIDSGLVELELKQGTTLLIEGPAQWTVDGENAATLKRGKLVAEVPQQAIGFTLTTPTAKIVDLGTEFGVEVALNGNSDLHVRQGAVEVNAASERSSKHAVRLTAGQAARISAGDQRVLPIPADDARFDLRRPSVPPAFTLGPIELVNPSFELPAVVPPLEMKRPEDWFITAEGTTADVGLQVSAAGQFVYWNEPAGSLGQFIGGHRVPRAGITYRLKFRVAAANNGRCSLTTRLLINELTDEQRTLRLELTACPWRTEELTYTTTAADVGKRVGVVFEFATLDPGVQVSLDEVTLETLNPTDNPEATK